MRQMFHDGAVRRWMFKNLYVKMRSLQYCFASDFFINGTYKVDFVIGAFAS